MKNKRRPLKPFRNGLFERDNWENDRATGVGSKPVNRPMCASRCVMIGIFNIARGIAQRFHGALIRQDVKNKKEEKNTQRSEALAVVESSSATSVREKRPKKRMLRQLHASLVCLN